MADAYLTRRGSVVRTGMVMPTYGNGITIPGLGEARNAIMTLCNEGISAIEGHEGLYITSITIEDRVIKSITVNDHTTGRNPSIVFLSEMEIDLVIEWYPGDDEISIYDESRFLTGQMYFCDSAYYKYILY